MSLDVNEAVEPLVLTLDPPVRAKGGECASITLTEPRARHVRDAEKKLDAKLSEGSITEYEMALIADCSDVDASVVGALTARQSGAAFNWLQTFVGDSYSDIGDDSLEDLPDGPFELPIEPPLRWNGIEYAVLPLREPTLEEKKKSQQFTRQAMTPYTVRCRDMELLKLVTGLPAAVIDGLRIRTQVEAARQLARFIEAGRRAGKASPSS